MSTPTTIFAPVEARTGNPIRLAMQRLWLTGQVLPVGARLVVQHVFQSSEQKPLEVIYSFPLPRDATLRQFRITGDGFETCSELKPTEEAVRAYENGIAGGSLSALARQYGDGLVNLTVGNIRPMETVTVYLEVLAGVEARDDGFRFRFPFTLAPSYHSKARVAVADGEGEMELPAGEFGDLMLPGFRKDASSLHQVGFELFLPHQPSLEEIGSPSHSVRVKHNGTDPARVALAPERDVPNRDLVLDVRYRESKTQVLAGPVGEGKSAFAVVVPSQVFGEPTDRPRRTVILLDRSGSMEGAPIAQARKAIEACLAAMSERDEFLLMAFADEVEVMGPALFPATSEKREAARDFLRRIEARGGTELAAGVKEASRLLGGEGDILIITDGQVFGTEAILAEARATGLRLFCLGIGSASQDRFLALLARETGGNSRFVTPRERVDLAAIDLFASIGRPAATGLKADHVEPAPPPVVFAGSPVVLFGEVERASKTAVDLAWDGGIASFEIPEGDPATGEAVRLLRGSRLITDWESRYPSTEANSTVERRRENRVAARLVELSKTFGLASREMALVVVVKRTGDRPGELPETQVVPVGMPEDMLFLAKSLHPSPQASITLRSPAPLSGVVTSFMETFSLLRASVDMPGEAHPSPGAPPQVETAAHDLSNTELVDLAGMLEPDGGMPGADAEIRLCRTIAAVLAFVAEGHSMTVGAFRLHVSRLAGFLQAQTIQPGKEQQWIDAAIHAAVTGTTVPGPWLSIARKRRTGWLEIEASLRQGLG